MARRLRDEVGTLWFVYWNNNRRKCMVDGKDEEEAIQKARRFCGKHATISKVERIDL